MILFYFQQVIIIGDNVKQYQGESLYEVYEKNKDLINVKELRVCSGSTINSDEFNAFTIVAAPNIESFTIDIDVVIEPDKNLNFDPFPFLQTVNSGSFENISGPIFMNQRKIKSFIGPKITQVGPQAFFNSTIETIDLPNAIEIGSKAFQNCSNLLEIFLPTVEKIGEGSFQSSKFKQVVSKDFPKLEVIGAESFAHSPELEEAELLVKQIGDWCFQDCPKLKSINFNLITHVPDMAFESAVSLEFVQIKDCESIGDASFSLCNSLKSIYLHQVVNIGDNCFSGCRSLTEIRGSTVQLIGQGAFYGCISLMHFHEMMESVMSIQALAFYSCTNITTISAKKLLFIGIGAFEDCINLESVGLGHVSQISSECFKGCSSLTNVSPAVEVVGRQSFYACDSLQYISLTSVVEMGEEAFAACVNLQEVQLELLTTIPEKAFYKCASLASVVADKVRTVDQTAFSLCMNLSSIQLMECDVIKKNAFAYCCVLFNIAIPKIRSIEDNAFRKCTCLKVLELEEATTFHETAFAESGVVKVNCSQLKYIQADCFCNCTFLEEVTANSLKSINERAFSECTKLKIITMLRLEQIDEFGFQRCGIVELYLPLLHTIGKACFYGCENLAVVNLPNITQIASSSFCQCTKLRELHAPEAQFVTNSAFANCSSLSLLNFTQLYTIDAYAFSSCFSLKKIDLPDTVKVGACAFSRCSELESIKLPHCEILEYQAFADCHKLYSVDLRQVEQVGKNCFLECALEVFDFPKLIDFDQQSFAFNKYLTNLTIVTVAKFNERVFMECTGVKCVTLTNTLVLPADFFRGMPNIEAVDLGKVVSLCYQQFFNLSLLETIVANFVLKLNHSFVELPELQVVQLKMLKEANYTRAFTNCTRLQTLYLGSDPPDGFHRMSSSIHLVLPRATDHKIYDNDLSCDGDKEHDFKWCGLSVKYDDGSKYRQKLIIIISSVAAALLIIILCIIIVIRRNYKKRVELLDAREALALSASVDEPLAPMSF